MRPRTGQNSSSFLHRRCWEIRISLATSLSEIHSLMPRPHPIERSLWTQPDRHQSPFITACVTRQLTIPSMVPLSSNAAFIRLKGKYRRQPKLRRTARLEQKNRLVGPVMPSLNSVHSRLRYRANQPHRPTLTGAWPLIFFPKHIFRLCMSPIHHEVPISPFICRFTSRFYAFDACPGSSRL